MRQLTKTRSTSGQTVRRAAGTLLAIATVTVVAALPGQASASVPSMTARTNATVTGNGAFVSRVIALTNAQRAKYKCPALVANAALGKAAQAHSIDMASRDYFSHYTLGTNRSPATRITAAGYKWQMAAENIAAGQRTPDAVVIAWMNSPGHRANILNCKLKQIGVGYAYKVTSTYGSYWTQDFGAPKQ
jgi:uncharacterized protein YkwD